MGIKKYDIMPTFPTAKSSGYFEVYQMDLEGNPYGTPTRVNTETGLILNCDHRCDAKHVRRMAEMARLNADYPYDVCAYVGPSGDRRLVWNVRLYWRKAK